MKFGYARVSKNKQSLDVQIQKLTAAGFDDVLNTLPGWDYRVKDYLIINKQFIYEYDYGWIHLIEFEGEYPKQDNIKYPVCLDGERACPPEDVGGIPGYEHFIEVISKPKHPEREEMLEWVGRSYDPNHFDPKKVKFDNLTKRWKKAFKQEGYSS